MVGVDPVDVGLLERPLYTFAEADYLAGVSRGTTSRWLMGYHYRRPSGRLSRRPPVTQRDLGEEKGVSFLDLIEVVAIGGLKKLDFSLLEIRHIVENCQQVLHVARPLVSLELSVGGHEVFVSHQNDLLEILKGKGQRAWREVLGPFVETLDYQGHLARRWWPLGKDVPVLLDPEYAFGLPVVKDSGVRTEIILERFQVGDLPPQIARDFNVTETDVDRALQFELSRLKPAA